MSIPAYNNIPVRPSALKNTNPLAATIGSVIGVDSRLAELNNHFKWKKIVNQFTNENKTFNPIMPQCKMVRLGDFKLDVDIQRDLDKLHCYNIALNYDPNLAQSISATKVPGKEEYHSTDGQHTLVTTAGLVEAGFFGAGLKWEDFKIACTYVETTNKAFARKAFKLINGKGKKRLTKYDEHRSEVLSARIDGSVEPEDMLAGQKQTIMEKHLCFPVPTWRGGQPGAVTHLSGALKLSLPALEFACKWHNDYFHYEPTHGTTWFMFDKIQVIFNDAGIDMDDLFLNELAGIVQHYFSTPAGLGLAVQQAFPNWALSRHGYDMSFETASCGVLLMQMYVALGGTHNVPRVILDNYKDLYTFVSASISNNYVVVV